MTIGRRCLSGVENATRRTFRLIMGLAGMYCILGGVSCLIESWRWVRIWSQMSSDEDQSVFPPFALAATVIAAAILISIGALLLKSARWVKPKGQRYFKMR